MSKYITSPLITFLAFLILSSHLLSTSLAFPSIIPLSANLSRILALISLSLLITQLTLHPPAPKLFFLLSIPLLSPHFSTPQLSLITSKYPLNAFKHQTKPHPHLYQKLYQLPFIIFISKNIT